MPASRGIEGYRQRLLAARARLKEEQAQLKGDVLLPVGEAMGSPPGGYAPSGERSQELGEEVTLNVLRNEEDLLGEVEAALIRLERGTFGQCEKCRHRIAASRLRAVPHARYCIACARKFEEEPE